MLIVDFYRRLFGAFSGSRLPPKDQKELDSFNEGVTYEYKEVRLKFKHLYKMLDFFEQVYLRESEESL